MILILFLIGFILGLAYTLIGEKMPLLLPEVTRKEDNSWILNLFSAVINAIILLISYYEYGFSYEMFTAMVVSGLVIIIFVSDFKYMIILDSPLIISGIIMLILRFSFNGIKDAAICLLSGVILFTFMLLISFIGKKIFKREALGGGDIKLAAVIGIILNLKLGLVAIIFSSLLALPYAIGAMLLNKDSEVPFGPFLIGSVAIVFIFSDKFMNFLEFLG